MAQEPARALVLVFGHSHTTCMVKAMRQKLYPTVSPDIAFRVVGYGSKAFPGGLVVSDANGEPVSSPVVLAAIDRAVADAKGREVWLLSVIGGNAANRFGIFRSGPGVDFMLPGEPVAPALQDPGGSFIPYDAVESTMQRHLDGFAQFLKLLPRQRVAGIAHLEGPPPCMSNAYVAQSLSASAQQLVRDAGIQDLTEELVADPAYRHRLWRCQAEVTRRIVEAAGGLYIGPPPAALDETGHRRLETCSDACHGTPDYGAMALAHVKDTILARSREREQT